MMYQLMKMDYSAKSDTMTNAPLCWLAVTSFWNDIIQTLHPVTITNLIKSVAIIWFDDYHIIYTYFRQA